MLPLRKLLPVALLFSALGCSTNPSPYDSSFLSKLPLVRQFKGFVNPNSATAICGNGQQEAGEDCDGGICCDRNCHFQNAAMVCDFIAGTKCSGNSASCSTNRLPYGTSYFNASTGVCP